MLALYAGALDTRIRSVAVCGYFGNRQRIWGQPIDRNVFGLLDEFGDAELAALIAPRGLVLEQGGGPEVTLPGQSGAQAHLVPPSRTEFDQERARIPRLFRNGKEFLA